MKKIILILIVLKTFTFSSEYTSLKVFEENKNILQPGDIVVLEKKENNIMSFGHVLFIAKDMSVVEFRGYGEGIAFTPLPIYLSQNKSRSGLILRYKDMNDEILSKIDENLTYWSTKYYDVLISNYGDDYLTYCTEFVSSLFKESIKEATNVDLETVNNKKSLIIGPQAFLGMEVYKKIKIGDL